MHKRILRLALFTALILLIPLALTIRDGAVEGVGWNWTAFDFVFAGVLIFGTGFAFELAMRTSRIVMYRAAAALGLAAAFLLTWVNGAVGLIGGEGNPINMLFLGVPLVGLLGAAIARLKPRGMARTLYTMAALTILIPTAAILIVRPPVPAAAPSEMMALVRTFGASGFFAVLLLGSGLLFRNAALAQPRTAAKV
jgi:hypothetical protein